jgi:hypothetical protein
MPLEIRPIQIPSRETRDLAQNLHKVLPQFSYQQILRAVRNIIKRGDLPTKELVVREINIITG